MEKKPYEGAPEEVEGSKRHRRNSAEKRLRLVAECEVPGSSVSLLARKYGISSSRLFRWRHRCRRRQVVLLEVKSKGGRMTPARVDLHARLRGRSRRPHAGGSAGAHLEPGTPPKAQPSGVLPLSQ